MKFKNPSIKLRKIKRIDKKILYSWINNRNLVKLSSHFKKISKKNHNKWFKKIQKKNKKEIFFIIENQKKKPIGSCQLNQINKKNKTANLQIRIARKSNRGKGYGSLAIQELVKLAFSKMNLKKINLQVFQTNKIAISAYKKCGFKFNKKTKRKILNNKKVNILYMSKINNE